MGDRRRCRAGCLVFFRVKTTWAPQAPLGFLTSHFLAGAAVGIFAGLFEFALEPALLRLAPGSFAVFVQAFVVAALIEESLKCVGIKAAADRAQAMGLDAYGALAAALSVGLGFAVLECALYALADVPNSLTITLARYVTAVPLHYLNGMLFAIAYVSRRYGMTVELGWLFLVVVAHGFYDYVLFNENGDEILILVVLFGLGQYVRWTRTTYGIKTAAERAAIPVS